MTEIKYFIEDYWKWIIGILSLIIIISFIFINNKNDGNKEKIKETKVTETKKKKEPYLLDLATGKEIPLDKAYDNSSNKINDNRYLKNKTLDDLTYNYERKMIDYAKTIGEVYRFQESIYGKNYSNKLKVQLFKDNRPQTFKEAYIHYKKFSNKPFKCGNANLNLNDCMTKLTKDKITNKEDAKIITDKLFENEVLINNFLTIHYKNPIKNEVRYLDTTKILSYKMQLNHLDWLIVKHAATTVKVDNINNIIKDRNNIHKDINSSFDEILSINK